MNSATMMALQGEGSVQCKARMTGVLFLTSVVSALAGELLLHGSGSIAAGLVAVACYLAVTLLFFTIFKHVSRSTVVLAVTFNFAGLALEALRWQPWNTNLAMVLHGVYCLLMGFVIIRSQFVPRLLGGLMAFAGLLWLINVAPVLTSRVATYTMIPGLLGEASPYLWLLVMGVNLQRWHVQAAMAETPRPQAGRYRNRFS